MVKDGTMIMIAGLMKEDRRDDTTGIPFLSKIPIIGAAFGARAAQKKKTEIIIFLTPHIISGANTPEGMKFKKYIPPEMVPYDMEDDIIADAVDEIKVSPGKKDLLRKSAIEDIFGKEKDAARKQVVSEPGGIQRRFKGLKEY